MGTLRPKIGAAPLLAAAALLAGCGDDPNRDDAAGAGARAVKIVDFVYEPDRVVVPKGTTIAFANRDAAPHTATSKQAGAFDTGPIKNGQSGEISLEETGTFAYYCLFHPFMKGTIVVE